VHIADNIAVSESSPVFFQGWKLSETNQSVLWNLFNKYPDLPTINVLEQANLLSCSIQISVRHVNRIRKSWGFNRSKGRPVCLQNSPDREVDVVKVEPLLPSIGVHLFSEWMESGDEFPKILSLLNQARDEWQAEHADEFFPLLNHKDETLLMRFKALFYARYLVSASLQSLIIKNNVFQHCLNVSKQHYDAISWRA
jgi:hypothetical protein